MKTLISIIIPFYNAINYIEETINSALSQTYTNIEIIIINDGMKFDLNPLLENKFHNNLIKYFTQNNGGPSSARNMGIRKANGEAIAFLDQDDIWHPDKLKLQAQLFEKDNTIGIASCLSTIIDESNNIIAPNLGKIVKGNFYNQSLLCDPIGGGSVALIKKECLEKVGFFDETIHGREDWDLWIRILKEYNIDTVNKALVGYRRLPNSLSQNHVSMISGGKKALEKAKKTDTRITNSLHNKHLINHELAIIRLCLRDNAYDIAWQLTKILIKNHPTSLITNMQMPIILLYLFILSIMRTKKQQEAFKAFIYKLFFNCTINQRLSFN